MPSKKILTMAKEVKETTDNNEAALLVQNGWVIVWSVFKGKEIQWVLIRV